MVCVRIIDEDNDKDVAATPSSLALLVVLSVKSNAKRLPAMCIPSAVGQQDGSRIPNPALTSMKRFHACIEVKWHIRMHVLNSCVTVGLHVRVDFPQQMVTCVK